MSFLKNTPQATLFYCDILLSPPQKMYIIEFFRSFSSWFSAGGALDGAGGAPYNQGTDMI